MNLKLEKINMKIVIIAGIAVILVLTALFILFRTNILFDNNSNKDKDKSNTNTATNTNTNTNTGTNTNTNHDDPDDPKNMTVSESAKNRTKSTKRLNIEEKKYIINENAEKAFEDKEKNVACMRPGANCTMDVSSLKLYSEDEEIGFFIHGCSGTVTAVYDEAKKEFIIDMSKVVCK